MEIWMSSEKDVLVGKAEHTARNKVEPIVNQLLHKVELACGLERWSVIFIVMRDEWIGSYPEIKRYHKSKKDVELRVQLPFFEFKDADDLKQIKMLLDALSRSVDMMEEINNLKLTKEDARALRESVEKARVQLGCA